MHVGQGGDRCGVQRVGEAAVEGVGGEVDVAEVAADFTCAARGAVGFGVGAEVGNLIAVGEEFAVFAAGNVDTGDTCQFSPQWSQNVFGILEPLDLRRNGASCFSP